jgi:hypothetical protein
VTNTLPAAPDPPAEATTALMAVVVDHPIVATGTFEITTDGVGSYAAPKFSPRKVRAVPPVMGAFTLSPMVTTGASNV